MKRQKVFAGLDDSPTVHLLVKSHNEIAEDLDHIDTIISKMSLKAGQLEKDVKLLMARQREMG